MLAHMKANLPEPLRTIVYKLEHLAYPEPIVANIINKYMEAHNVIPCQAQISKERNLLDQCKG